jgi:transposase
MAKSSIFGVKIVEPCRGQVAMKWSSIDGDLPADHLARALDRIVGSLDIGPFLRRSRSLAGGKGRPVVSPRMMLVLWLYAIIDGVGSAREIERLTTAHDAYKWIVGNLAVSHDAISIFRVAHGAAFSQILREILTRLLAVGLLDLSVVAQDGTRIRASAGAPSFRTLPALEECREHAKLHLEAVLLQAKDPELSHAARATREAKARDYASRVEAAVEALATLPENRKGEPRASTTDPDARVMKMGDGGFRPAYNVQLAIAGDDTGGPRAVVGLQVTTMGSDMGSLMPMANDIETRTSRKPGAVLADTGHFKRDDLEALRSAGIRPVVPPPRPRKCDSQLEQESLEDWRFRKMTPGEKLLFRRRSSLCEHANAAIKGTYGLDQFLVRGIDKVTACATLYALTFTVHQNLHRLLDLI